MTLIMETPHGSSGRFTFFPVLLLLQLQLLLLKGGSSAPISISSGADSDGERRSLGETGPGYLPSSSSSSHGVAMDAAAAA